MSTATASMSTTGVGINLGIQWRTGWKTLAGWVLGLLAVVGLTASSITSLYETPQELAGYAEASSGPAIRMLNGDVAGMDGLGGVLANELGFVVAFAIPIMAISLTGRGTRREEESGRLELLLASRMGRQAPLVAAVVLALAAFATLGALTAVILAVAGADTVGSILYGCTLLGLGAVFVGVTAVLAQAFGHQRSVWAAGLGIMLAAYIIRGAGAVEGTWLVWLSPHGWYDEAAPFGDPQAIPFVVSAVVTAVLLAVALRLSAGRDVGGSLVRPSAGPDRAAAGLRTPVGLALREHRMATIGWALVSAILMGTYGSLTQTVIDAFADNPDLQAFIAGSEEAVVESTAAMFVLMVAMLISAYVVQYLGSLRTEETSGRLELQLSDARGRVSWLLPHLGVLVVGTLVVAAAGGLALGASTAWSLDDASWVGTLVGATAAHLPAALLFAGFSVALFGWLPRAQTVTWAVFAAAVVIGYMGPGLDLPEALIEWSPFGLVGNVPAADLDVTGAVVAVVAGLVLAGLGVIGFVRRDVPHS